MGHGIEPALPRFVQVANTHSATPESCMHTTAEAHSRRFCCARIPPAHPMHAWPPLLHSAAQATPTAAGVAGLVWSAHPECTSDELIAAVSWSAKDLGKPGYDEEYGFGLVQAEAAHEYLVANPCRGGGASEPPRTSGSLNTAHKLSLTVNGPRSKVMVGETVQVSVQVARASPAAASVEGVAVRITTEPEGRLRCTQMQLSTNAVGNASTTCRVIAHGGASVTATIGSGRSAVAADREVTTVRARRGRGGSEVSEASEAP
jgi:Subtilase family